MSDIQSGDRLRVPGWLMSSLVGGMILIAGAGIKTWADTSSNNTTITNHEGRIGTVEGKLGTMQSDVAVIKQQMLDQRQHDSENAAKLDRILVELQRSRQQ